MSTATLLFLSLVSLSTLSLSLASVQQDELKALLEFKKGIKSDPLNKILTSWTPPDPPQNDTCLVKSFYGIKCDNYSNFVVSIELVDLQLTGDLKFNTLTGLKQLRNLTIKGNFLTGRVVPGLGSMSSLQYLDLSGNEFVGPIPERVKELWGLMYLNLSNNGFSGGFPAGLSGLQQLRVLDLHNNGIYGDVREVIADLRNVDYLDLSRNRFSGSVDMSVENVSGFANTIQYVDLSGNYLGGRFFGGDVIGRFRSLRFLDVGDNGISGELPSFGVLSNLGVLRLRNNMLSGSIPADLVEGVVPLQELDLSGNGFSGSIPIVNSSSLRTLNLSSNVLSGLLPVSVGNCKIVDLSRNNLSDDIAGIQNWGSSLEIVDLSSNRLTGSIPAPPQFKSLISFNCGSNLLEGGVRIELGEYDNLTTLDLSSNKLNGTIPRTFFTSLALTNLNLSWNRLSGSIPLGSSQIGEFLVLPSVPKLESLDLSHNTLDGHLSPSVGNLMKLKLLNLSSNHLSGGLPDELSKLDVLEYLDLSNNAFDGKIPDKLSSNLKLLNVSNNELSGRIPENLRNFSDSSFHPGNILLFPQPDTRDNSHLPDQFQGRKKHHMKSNVKVAIIVATVGAALMIAFVFLAYYLAQRRDFRVTGFGEHRDAKVGMLSRPSIFKFHTTPEPPQTSLSFSDDHLLTSHSRSLSGKIDSGSEIVEHVLPESAANVSATEIPNLLDYPTTSGRKSFPGSPITSSPRFADTLEQPVMLDVNSPDRLAGELFFLDSSLTFTAEELSRAPAEVLGRSNHGTLYKATLDSGHMLTVKWLRVGLVKNKKEFAKEVKKIGSVKHPNINPLRAYYWGPREQERLILADYIRGDSLSLHLYETTPRRYSPLSLVQRLKVAVDVARCLVYLHDRGMPHGNLKPTNILLAGSDLNVRLTDYGLHRLMTPAGIAEQILNLGALGYRPPELATAAKPMPSTKADVYALGVIIMELLTRRSAGDIISGQSGAVDLTDWVRLYDQEGRGVDCFDRDLANREENTRAMDELLAISLRCIHPVNERPNSRQVFEDLQSITM
ncbi:hypothetical protein LIER_08782 [Lithospermum erythrorhizon]|uniref:Protein kinase domain-containing protein n=1 Tax=Lithospermum erythrorhizon TaxID=34254 RepID=A0AAV3PEF9_LITER